MSREGKMKLHNYENIAIQTHLSTTMLNINYLNYKINIGYKIRLENSIHLFDVFKKHTSPSKKGTTMRINY